MRLTEAFELLSKLASSPEQARARRVAAGVIYEALRAEAMKVGRQWRKPEEYWRDEVQDKILVWQDQGMPCGERVFANDDAVRAYLNATVRNVLRDIYRRETRRAQLFPDHRRRRPSDGAVVESDPFQSIPDWAFEPVALLRERVRLDLENDPRLDGDEASLRERVSGRVRRAAPGLEPELQGRLADGVALLYIGLANRVGGSEGLLADVCELVDDDDPEPAEEILAALGQFTDLVAGVAAGRRRDRRAIWVGTVRDMLGLRAGTVDVWTLVDRLATEPDEESAAPGEGAPGRDTLRARLYKRFERVRKDLLGAIPTVALSISEGEREALGRRLERLIELLKFRETSDAEPQQSEAEQQYVDPDEDEIHVTDQRGAR